MHGITEGGVGAKAWVDLISLHLYCIRYGALPVVRGFHLSRGIGNGLYKIQKSIVQVECMQGTEYSVYELLDVKSFDLGQGRYREALLLTEVCSKCPGLSSRQCSNRKLVAPPPSDEIWMAMF
jgi:hypothetical protein